MPRLLLALLGVLAAPLPTPAQNDVPSAERPVAVWKFDGGAEPGVPKAAQSREPGPRPPAYPSFPANNSAMAFTAARSRSMPGPPIEPEVSSTNVTVIGRRGLTAS